MSKKYVAIYIDVPGEIDEILKNAEPAFLRDDGNLRVMTDEEIGPVVKWLNNLKMKTLIAFFLLAAPLHASVIVETGGSGTITVESGGSGTVTMVGAEEGGGSFTPDFYFNCDSVTDGQSPTIGEGTITIGSNLSTDTGVVGNGIAMDGGFSSRRVSIDAANIDPAEGCMGWYVKFNAHDDGDPIYINGADVGSASTAAFHLRFVGDSMTFIYKDEECGPVQSDFGTGSFRHVTWCWDSDQDKLGAAFQVKVDNTLICDITGTDGTTPADGSLRWGGLDGNGTNMVVDQFMISNDPTASDDLYANRNETSF